MQGAHQLIEHRPIIRRLLVELRNLVHKRGAVAGGQPLNQPQRKSERLAVGVPEHVAVCEPVDKPVNFAFDLAERLSIAIAVAFAELVASPRAIGTRWRFGSDFWTSLDTSVPLQIGEVEVPAGYYYLTLVQPEAGHFVLGLHDAAAVRKAHMDASQAAQLEGGIEVPLAHHADERATDKLSIAVQLDEGRDRGHLRIALGPHRLDAPVTAKLAQ